MNADRLEVRDHVAIVFATRTQLLQAVTSLPEQLDQNGYDNFPFGGSVVFTTRPGRTVIPNFKAQYVLNKAAAPDGTTPTFSLEVPNWQGMGNDKLRQASDSLLKGGRPAEVKVGLSSKPAVVEGLRVDFLPGLLSKGYRPEYAYFSNIRTGSGWINEVTLAHKGVVLSEIPTLVVGRRGNADRWMERVILEYGAAQDDDWIAE